MSANAYTVNSVAPIQIFPDGAGGALTLYNTDTTNTVYVGEYPDNNGFPMSPGMTLSWDAGRSLYAYVDAGNTVSLVVVSNAGNIFSAKSIADQIIAAGLATDIANAIVNSGLTSANIASQINLAGVPPIDTQTVVLDSGLVALNSGVPYVTAVLDVSRYQSLYIHLFDLGFNTNIVPDIREVDLDWYTVAQGGDLIDRDVVGLSDSFGNAFGVNQGVIVETPARGGGLKVTISDIAVSGNTSGAKATQVRFVLVGSYKAMTQLSYKANSSYQSKLTGATLSTTGPHDRVASLGYNKAGGTIAAWNMPVIGGEARLSVFAAASAAGVIWIEDMMDLTSSKRMYANVSVPIASGNGAFYQQNFFLPNRPCRMVLDSALVSGDVRAAVTFLGRN